MTGAVCRDLGGDEAYCYLGVARVDQRGALDPDFGGTGKVFTDVGSFGGSALDLAVQSDSKIVVVGGRALDSNFTIGNAILIRHQPDGSLDGTFGLNGISETNFGYSSSGSASLCIQSDGRIVTAGSTSRGVARGASAVTARYLGQ